MRIQPGELAVPLGRICQETGLSMNAAVQALKVGKNAGFLDVRSTPWALRIEVVNWQDFAQRVSAGARHRV